MNKSSFPVILVAATFLMSFGIYELENSYLFPIIGTALFCICIWLVVILYSWKRRKALSVTPQTFNEITKLRLKVSLLILLAMTVLVQGFIRFFISGFGDFIISNLDRILIFVILAGLLLFSVGFVLIRRLKKQAEGHIKGS